MTARVVTFFATRRMGYDRIETERAGRHLPRPYGEREKGAAYEAGMPDARGELTAQWRVFGMQRQTRD